MSHQIFANAGVFLALFIYGILIRNMVVGDQKQNLVTFVLCGALNVVAAGAAYFKFGDWRPWGHHGNWILPAGYLLASIGVIGATLWNARFWHWWQGSRVSFAQRAFHIQSQLGKIASWGLWEWVTLILVTNCVVIWATASADTAVVASALAIAFAQIPMFFSIRDDPYRHGAPLSYLGFTVANGISILGGTDWSVEQRFYPIVGTIAAALTVFWTMSCRMQYDDEHWYAA